MLTVIDEFTRRCMTVVVERRLNSDNVLHCLTELFVQHGPPDHIRSDNGSEFTAHAVRDWLGRIGVKTLYIEPGSPWENGYNESFNSKLRDEILNTEIFYTLKEAKVLIERWRHHYRAPLRIRDLTEDDWLNGLWPSAAMLAPEFPGVSRAPIELSPLQDRAQAISYSEYCHTAAARRSSWTRRRML